MPVVRSAYSVEQFEQVLQAMAHEFPKFRSVRTDELTIEFSYRDDGNCRKVNVRYHKRTGKVSCWRCNESFTMEEGEKHVKEKHNGDIYYLQEETEWWSFSVEPKAYVTTNHISKIDTGSPEAVLKFIEKIMAEANVKPIPRFTLAEHAARTAGEAKKELPVSS